MVKKHLCIDCGKVVSFYAKRCRKCSSIGVNNPFYGRKHTEKFKEIISKMNTGRQHPMKGKKQPKVAGKNNPACRPEVRALISKRVKETHWDSSGKNNPNYIDGRSWFPYPKEFNDKLRYDVRERDNFECQNCGMTEEEHLIVLGEVLHVHHVDYDKLNSLIENLLTLCNWCNTRANYNREYWKEKFKKRMIEILEKII